MKPSLRVGFAWQTLTSENLGVAALAQAQLAIARSSANVAGARLEVIEFCPTGPRTELAKALECEIADPLSLKQMVLGKSRYCQQMKGCDLILDIGAGDSFSDIYGTKHFLFVCLTKAMSIWLGKPLVLSPQTIGPFSRPWVAFVASILMKRSQKVFARDGLSMRVLQQLGLQDNSVEVVDVAFLLPFEPSRMPPSDKIRVGLNVSGLLMSGGYTRDNQFSLAVDYSKLVRAIIKNFLANPQIELHLVGHVLADMLPVEDDYAANLQLQSEYPDLVVAPKFNSPSDAKSYISGLDFFAGSRMHACIAAFSSGVPTVPLAYSRKFNGLFAALEYPHFADMLVDSEDQILTKLLDCFERRLELRMRVANGNALALKKLEPYQNYLTQLFGDILGKRETT